MSGFEPDCPVLGRLVLLENFSSKRTQIYRYIHMYTVPDPQFLAPIRSLAWKQVKSVRFFRRADLGTLILMLIQTLNFIYDDSATDTSCTPVCSGSYPYNTQRNVCVL